MSALKDRITADMKTAMREKDKERGGRLAEDDDNYNRRAREEREQREKDSGFIRSGKDRGGKDDAGGKDEWGK